MILYVSILYRLEHSETQSSNHLNALSNFEVASSSGTFFSSNKFYPFKINELLSEPEMMSFNFGFSMSYFTLPTTVGASNNSISFSLFFIKLAAFAEGDLSSASDME